VMPFLQIFLQKSVLISFLSYAFYMPRPYHPFDLIMLMSGEAHKLWTSSLYNFLRPPVISSLLNPIILFKLAHMS
jgi:hypothetical protein